MPTGHEMVQNAAWESPADPFVRYAIKRMRIESSYFSALNIKSNLGCNFEVNVQYIGILGKKQTNKNKKWPIHSVMVPSVTVHVLNIQVKRFWRSKKVILVNPRSFFLTHITLIKLG